MSEYLEEAVYLCLNDSYDQEPNTYTLRAFRAMVLDCFEEDPDTEQLIREGSLVLVANREKVEQLEVEARMHHDFAMARLCSAALEGDVQAWDECVAALVEAYQARVLDVGDDWSGGLLIRSTMVLDTDDRNDRHGW